MVYSGFRNPQLDIPESRPTSGTVCSCAAWQHDEENMDARPDKEEMEQVINKETREVGLQGPATVLSQLPKPAQG